MQQTMFNECSTAALAAQTPDKLSRDQRRIVEYVASQREHGATRWECHKATGISYTTVTPRALELLTAGKLIETERKRRTGNGSMARVLVAPIPTPAAEACA